MKTLTKLCVLFALFGTTAVSAQKQAVYVDIAPCLALQNDAERNSCYVARAEELRATLATATTVPAQAVPANVAATAPIPTAHMGRASSAREPIAMDDFGREPPAAVALRETNARVLALDDGSVELIDTIAALDERLPNTWEITLSNGQVWRQVNSEKYRLRQGMEVRIYPSGFSGSFRLSGKGVNGFIQVRRIE